MEGVKEKSEKVGEKEEEAVAAAGPAPAASYWDWLPLELQAAVLIDGMRDATDEEFCNAVLSFCDTANATCTEELWQLLYAEVWWRKHAALHLPPRPRRVCRRSAGLSRRGWRDIVAAVCLGPAAALERGGATGNQSLLDAAMLVDTWIPSPHKLGLLKVVSTWFKLRSQDSYDNDQAFRRGAGGMAWQQAYPAWAKAILAAAYHNQEAMLLSMFKNYRVAPSQEFLRGANDNRLGRYGVLQRGWEMQGGRTVSVMNVAVLRGHVQLVQTLHQGHVYEGHQDDDDMFMRDIKQLVYQAIRFPPGNTEMLRVLLTYKMTGKNPYYHDDFQLLWYIAREGSTALMEAFEDFRIHLTPLKLYYAVHNPMYPIFGLPCTTVVHEAIEGRNYEMLSWLLDKTCLQADTLALAHQPWWRTPGGNDAWWRTPLSTAFYQVFNDALASTKPVMRTPSMEAVRILCKHKTCNLWAHATGRACNLNKVKLWGDPILVVAVRAQYELRGRTALVRFLLQNGAARNKTGFDGRSPWLVARTELTDPEENDAITDLLEQYGAVPTPELV